MGNEAMALVVNTQNYTNVDGNVGSMQKINKWNDKLRQEIVNEEFNQKMMEQEEKQNGDAQMDNDQLDEEYVVVNGDNNKDKDDEDKEKEFVPKSSLTQKLLNKKRTFSELEHENVDANDMDVVDGDEEEENPVFDDNVIELDQEDSGSESTGEYNADKIKMNSVQNRTELNGFVDDDGNDMKDEIASMIKSVDIHNEDKDDDAEPLWTY